MKPFKTLVLTLTIFLGAARTAPAAFIKQNPATVATASVALSTMTVAPTAVNEIQSVETAAIAKKAKKAGLLQRFGAWYARQMAGDSQIVALLLSIFLGYIAVDRFYLGRTVTGLLKLFTFGGFGIWYIIDIILIATGALKPRRGEYADAL